MASAHEAIYGRLNTASGVRAISSGRIFPGVIEQNVRLPAITYFKVSDPRIHANVRDPGIAEPRFQVSMFSTSFSQVQSLAKQVRLALQDYSGSTWGNVHRVFIESESDLTEIEPDDQQVIHHVVQEYIVWWST